MTRNVSQMRVTPTAAVTPTMAEAIPLACVLLSKATWLVKPETKTKTAN